MGKSRKRVKYDNISAGESRQNVMHDKYIYEVEYPYGTTLQLQDTIIAQKLNNKLTHKSTIDRY